MNWDFGDLNVSRETVDRLEVYETLLEKWTQKINLIAPRTIKEIRVRHVLDSAQLLKHATLTPKKWLDIGSGGGLPGLVVAILLTETHPTARVTLVESDLRKATFLRTVIRETALDAQVLAGRVENIPPFDADVLSARALAPLPLLLTYVSRHLSSSGVALLHKGANWKQEVQDASEQWKFSLEAIKSETDRDAVILRIGDLRHV